MTKYMIEYAARMTASPDENIESAGRLISSFERWTPEDVDVLLAVDRLDGTSGYMLVSSESTESLTSVLARFAPFASFEVHPVVDFEDSLPLIRVSLEWARSVSF